MEKKVKQDVFNENAWVSGDFLPLSLFAGHFSLGEVPRAIEGRERKRLERFLREVPSGVSVVVLSSLPCETKGKIASIEEHYEYATPNPAAVFVRRDIAEGLENLDFRGLCLLFLRQQNFCVFERETQDFIRVPWRKEVEGTYGTKPEQYLQLISELKTAGRELLPFFQMMIIKDMFHLFFGKEPEHGQILREVLEMVEDDVICGCGCIPEDILLKIFSFKYERDIEESLVYRSGKLKYENLTVISLKELFFLVEDVTREKECFVISGAAFIPLINSDIHYYCMNNRNKEIPLVLEEGEEISFLGKKLSTRKHFRVEVPVKDQPVGIRFMYCYRELYHARVRVEFDEGMGIRPDSRENFGICGGFLIRLEKRILSFAPLKRRTKLKLFFTFPGKSFKIEKNG